MSALRELAALEDHGAFIKRHVAPTEDEIAAMLRVVGAASLEELAARTLPAAIAGATPIRAATLRAAIEYLIIFNLLTAFFEMPLFAPCGRVQNGGR